MELKVGMYVRYTRGAINGCVPPKIAKLVDCSDYVLVSIDNGQVILRNDVIKASYNIIDLIEVGDYVNGLPVVHNAKENGGNIVIVSNGSPYNEENIKSIVTKEQFNSVKYEVEYEKI